MDKSKLTVKEAAAEIGENPAIIRNWVRDLKNHIPFEKGENGYNLYGPEAMNVLRLIQTLHREQKYSMRQIEHHLLSGGQAAASSETQLQTNELAELRSKVDQLLAYQAADTDFKRELLEKLERRDQLLNDFLSAQREKRRLLRPGRRKWYLFFFR